MMEQNQHYLASQHQNEELKRNSFLGTLSPITGGMLTADNASVLIYWSASRI